MDAVLACQAGNRRRASAKGSASKICVAVFSFISEQEMRDPRLSDLPRGDQRLPFPRFLTLYLAVRSVVGTGQGDSLSPSMPPKRLGSLVACLLIVR